MYKISLISFIISASIIAYIFIGYPCLIFLIGSIKGLFCKDEIYDIEPTVTLIIAAFNEEECISEKLKNSLSIDYPSDKFEIFVVSDASTDKTDSIVRGFEERGVHLIISKERLGKTAGLNLAVPQAKGDIIVFSDANAMYQKDAIRKLVRNFFNEKVGYVVGQAKYGDIADSSAAKSENNYWKYEIFLKKMESRVHSVVGGDGAIYAIRKELYEKLLITDINDFVNPLQIILKGFRGLFEPEAICWENAAGSFAKEFQRKVRIVNRSFTGLMRVKAVMNPLKTGLFSLQVVSHKLLRWFIPVFIIIALLSFMGTSMQNANIFQYGFVLLSVFLLCSYIGYLLADHFEVWPIIYYPYFFVSGNVALLIGLYKSLMGRVQTTWTSARNAETMESPAWSWGKFLVHLSAIILIFVNMTIVFRLAGLNFFLLKLVFLLTFLLTIYIYGGYPVVLLILSRFFKKPVVQNDILPEVNLLICAYNEDDVIEQKIKNSFALDYPDEKINIIIASDGSTDRTNELVRAYECERLVLMAYPERCGKMGVINKTVPKLSGEIIIFSDANTMYKKDAVQKLVRNFYDSSVGAVSANVIIQNEETDFGQSESAYYRYERWIQEKESSLGSIIGADGGMYAIRRKLFVSPSSNIILDDFVVSMNVVLNGSRLVYDSEAIGYEQSKISCKTEFLRKSRVIAGAVQSLLQNEGVPSMKNRHLFFSYFSHKLLRWFTPIFLILLFVTNSALFLLLDESIYGYSFFLQLLFYSLAFMGIFFNRRVNLPIISQPFYFCIVNAAALYGIYKGFNNKQSVMWQTFKRNT